MNQQPCSQQLQQTPGPCPVPSIEQIPLQATPITPVNTPSSSPIIKTPVVLAETTLQIAVESNITFPAPGATEIKRVKKHVFLDQVKLVPVAFKAIPGSDFLTVEKAKLFVAGHIRKNIEFATNACSGALQDMIADVQFFGFAELKCTDFLSPPLFANTTKLEANFVDDTGLNARLDKAFFQNHVKYNEQPFGELVAADFFELDFSPTPATPEGTFRTLTEKIVLDLTLKVLQVQQIKVTGNPVVLPTTPSPCPPTTTSGC
ncbi:Uracil permease [Bacillus cereus]|uniref:CsxC family protein n=1 Tax=Bacillus paramycoides TaxID=2026194 RepID=UPI000BF6F063|nr:Uracil permease [Bacillus paramycoides]PFD38059.1 Uracil permease [Bacillus cereus]PGM63505.1 Uracil permease [Bacillus cereus]